MCCGRWLASAALPQLVSFKLSQPTPEGGSSQAFVFAGLPDPRTLVFII